MQVDHSHVAGNLRIALARSRAARVRSDGGRAPRHRLALVGGLPPLDAETGQPQNFLQVDIGLHLEFYEVGIAEVTARDAYAGMLVGTPQGSIASATARRPRSR